VWHAFVGCDPNTKNTDGQSVEENGTAQLGLVAARLFPSDSVAAANLVARSVSYVSYGAAQSKPYTYTAPAADGTPISGKLTRINGVSASPVQALNGTIATWRSIENVYRSSALKASVAAFLNWICDTDPARARHGLDRTTGKNYSDELSNTISTQFVLPRVPCKTDPVTGASVPPIGVAEIDNPND
jgi:hypothetical protein